MQNYVYRKTFTLIEMLIVVVIIGILAGALIPRIMNAQARANDAWLTPIIMKKGRPGILLSVLCAETLLDMMRELIFKHTTTIGIRYTKMDRLICDRTFKIVYYKGLQVHIKQSRYQGNLVNESIEFDDIHRISEVTGESYKLISQRIWSIVKAEKLT